MITHYEKPLTVYMGTVLPGRRLFCGATGVKVGALTNKPEEVNCPDCLEGMAREVHVELVARCPGHSVRHTFPDGQMCPHCGAMP